MRYYKNTFSAVINETLPQAKEPFLSPKQLDSLKTVSGVIVSIIAAAGIVALSAVAPNIFVALNSFFPRHSPGYSEKEKRRKIIKSFYYLKKSGLIKIKPTGRDYKVFLTALGRKRVQKLNFDTLRIPKTKIWDGKWWQVAADIPTKDHRGGADMLRKKLKEMGFFPLQRTLWFYPFDPTSEIVFILEHYGLGNFVTVMEVSRLDKDDEEKMKAFFKSNRVL
jgi:hypothetical protein